jgi:hypothetical protein
MSILNSIFQKQETEEEAAHRQFVESEKAPLEADAARMPKAMKNLEEAWGEFNQYVQREVYSARWPAGLPQKIESAIREAEGLRGNLQHVRSALEEFNTVTFGELNGCRFDGQTDPNCAPMWRASIASRFGGMNGAAKQIRYLQGAIKTDLEQIAKAAGMNLDQAYSIPAAPVSNAPRRPIVVTEHNPLKH